MGVGCRARFEDHSTFCRLAVRSLFFVLLYFLDFRCAFCVKMVGATDSGEIIFGLTVCGGYQIILRPGKFLF